MGSALVLLDAWPILAYVSTLSGKAEANCEHTELYKRDDSHFVSPDKNLPGNLTCPFLTHESLRKEAHTAFGGQSP